MNYLFSLLNFSNFISCQGLSLIAPFFPVFAQEKGVSQNIIGMIFSANPIGAVIASLLLGKSLKQTNQYMFMMVGLFLQSIGLMLFPLLPHITSRELIVALATAGRFIEGMGSSMLLTTFYALIPRINPKAIEASMAYAEFASSFGFLSGPILGSLLYSAGDFGLPFYFFSALLLVAMILFWILKNHQAALCPEADGLLVAPRNDVVVAIQAEAEVNSQESTDDEPEKTEIGYFSVICNYSVFISLLAVAIISILFTFYSPVYAEFVFLKYGIQADKVGYYMATTSVTYSISTFLVAKVRLGKKYFMFGGLFLTALAQPLMGQDFLSFEQISYTVLAQALYGFFAAFPYILSLPLINEVLQEAYPEQEETCQQIGSALFNTVVALGELIGPLASSYLVEEYGFPRSGTIMGIAILLVSLLFMPIVLSSKRQTLRYDEGAASKLIE